MTDSILARAARAAGAGWRQIGSTTNDAPRESDILFDVETGYYYMFTTEMVASIGPGIPMAIQSVAVGNPTTVTLAVAHDLMVGERVYALTIAGSSGVSGLNGTKFCICPTATTIKFFTNTSGTLGTPGTVSYQAAVAQVGMRRAATLEGLASATFPDFFSRCANSTYYPTVTKVGTGGSAVWHMWGYNSNGTGTSRQRFTGVYPTAGANPGTAIAFGTAVEQPMVLGDIHVRPNPVDGKYYAVGNVANTQIPLYRSDNPTTDLWTQVSTDVFNGGALAPSWATGNKPDPSLAFLDGNAYLLFNGAPAESPGEWNSGICLLDLATGLITGDVVRIQTYGSYAAWQNSQVLGDPVLVRGAQGDSIVGFHSAGIGATGTYSWGVLDLGDTLGRVHTADRRVGRADVADRRVGRVSISDALERP